MNNVQEKRQDDFVESGAKSKSWRFSPRNLKTPEMTMTKHEVNDISYQGA